MYSLRPTQYPVAMKFAHTQEELDAIPNMNYCQNKASVCKLISMAAYFQETFGLTRDDFSGPYCAINKGWMDVDQDYLDGSILYRKPTPWHHDQEDAKKHIAENRKLLPEVPFSSHALLFQSSFPHYNKELKPQSYPSILYHPFLK